MELQICDFATWCTPCVAELERFEKDLVDRFNDRNLRIVALGVGHIVEELRRFESTRRFRFPIAPVPPDVFKKYNGEGPGSIPRNYIIDRDGRVFFASSGYTEERFTELSQALSNVLSKTGE